VSALSARGKCRFALGASALALTLNGDALAQEAPAKETSTAAVPEAPDNRVQPDTPEGAPTPAPARAPEESVAGPKAPVPLAAIAPPQQSARHTDAHADRVILVPSAETHPEGTIFASSYDLIALLSAGYALTDRLQSSITGMTDGKSAFAELNLKANLLRSRFLRLALLSGIDYVHGSGDGGGFIFGRVGATVQICFELACRSSLSLHAMIVVHDEPDTILPMGLGAGFIARVADGLSALLEYSMLINASRDLPLITLPVYLVGYGMRISTHPSWALDITLLRRMRSDDQIRTGGTTVFDLIGIPLIAFTYRGKP
jgi:hypothetical protein